MLTELTIKDFMSTLASDSPVPGGGSVSALSGTAACSLIAMVASLTIGKKEYAEVWAEMSEIKSKVEYISEELIAAIDEDAKCYSRVIDSYKLPKNNDEEKSARSSAIQRALTEAALIPLGVAEKASALFDYAKLVIEKGNKNAASDGAVAALMARACVLGALYNVRINAVSVKDEEVKRKLLFEADRLEKEALSGEERVLKSLSF